MPGRRAKRFRTGATIPVGFIGSGARFTADLIDLSTTGCLLRCPEKVHIGDIGRLGIKVGHETLRVAATAIRDIPGVGVGFEFSQMYPRDRELLRKLLMWMENDTIPGT